MKLSEHMESHTDAAVVAGCDYCLMDAETDHTILLFDMAEELLKALKVVSDDTTRWLVFDMLLKANKLP